VVFASFQWTAAATDAPELRRYTFPVRMSIHDSARTRMLMSFQGSDIPPVSLPADEGAIDKANGGLRAVAGFVSAAESGDCLKASQYAGFAYRDLPISHLSDCQNNGFGMFKYLFRESTKKEIVRRFHIGGVVAYEVSIKDEVEPKSTMSRLLPTMACTNRQVAVAYDLEVDPVMIGEAVDSVYRMAASTMTAPKFGESTTPTPELSGADSVRQYSLELSRLYRDTGNRYPVEIHFDGYFPVHEGALMNSENYTLHPSDNPLSGAAKYFLEITALGRSVRKSLVEGRKVDMDPLLKSFHPRAQKDVKRHLDPKGPEGQNMGPAYDKIFAKHSILFVLDADPFFVVMYRPETGSFKHPVLTILMKMPDGTYQLPALTYWRTP
jgi:hypothetical protein